MSKGWTNDMQFYGKDLSLGPIVEPGVFTVRVGTAPDCDAGCAGSDDRMLADGVCGGPASLVCKQYIVAA